MEASIKPKENGKKVSSIKRRNIWAYIFLVPFFAVFLIFQLYPMLSSILIAFTDKSALTSQTINDWNLFYNFKYVWGKQDFWQSILNTFIIFTMNFIPQLIASLLFAVLFTSNRIRLRCSGFFRFVYFLPNILMASSVALTFYLMFEKQTGPLWNLLVNIGFINPEYDILGPENYWQVRGIVAFINFWMWFGNSMIIYISGIKGISNDIYESASIDNSSGLNTFFKITLPILKPLMVYSLITSVIGGLQMFDIPQLFLSGGPDGKGYFATQTITMWIYSMGLDFTQPKRYLGIAGAASIYLFIISLYFSLLLFKTMGNNDDQKTISVLDENVYSKRRKKVAAIFGIILGFLGIHHFILKNKKKGSNTLWILVFTLFVGLIPLWIIAIRDSIKLLKGKEIYEYIPKYNRKSYLFKDKFKTWCSKYLPCILTLGIYPLVKKIKANKPKIKKKVNIKNKIIGVFAILGGIIGLHKYFQKKPFEGLTYLLVSLSTFGIGAIAIEVISIMDAIELFKETEIFTINKRAKLNNNLLKIPAYVLCTVVALICILPIAFILLNATKTSNEINLGLSLIPGTNLFKNIETVFTLDGINVFTAFFSSVFVSFVGTALCLYFSSLTSFALYAYTFKLKKFAQTVIQMIILIPGQLGMIGFYKLMLDMELIPSYIPLVVPAIASASTVFYIQQYLHANFSRDYLDAARIDGASEIKIFNKICLPILKPAIATMGLLGIVSSWNNYMGPLVYIGTSDPRATLPLVITILKNNIYNADYGAIYAGILLTLLPLLIVYFFFSKWIMAGVASGGIKE